MLKTSENSFTVSSVLWCLTWNALSVFLELASILTDEVKGVKIKSLITNNKSKCDIHICSK